MIKLKKLLKEVRIINPNDYYNDPPLRDSETIRVYHGTSLDTATIFAIRGMSGREIAKRSYSFEAVNNPRGLFVTVDFKEAKKFADSIIVEFNTKVANLESPVWVGGRGYFGQGEYTSGFDDRGLGTGPESEREQQRMANRERARKDKHPQISQSDRPEVAEFIFGPEMQSLFIGDLNPNMIRALWVSKEGVEKGMYGPYQPLSRLEFIKQYAKPYIQQNKDYREKEKQQRGWNISNAFFDKLNSHKLFQPADDFDLQKAVKNLQARYPDLENCEELIKNFIRDALKGDRTNLLQAEEWLWPKQLDQLGIDLYDKA